jgi:hypothetical protein
MTTPEICQLAFSSCKQSLRVPVSCIVVVKQRCKFTDLFTKLRGLAPYL